VRRLHDRRRARPSPRLAVRDLGFAKLDHHRALRNGFPEVIFGEGKTTVQVVTIAERMAATGGNVLVTRLGPEAAEQLLVAVPGFEYDATARVAFRRTAAAEPTGRARSSSCRGTADLPVAEEAALSADVMGNRIERLYDVGVSGLHRLLERRDRLWTPQCSSSSPAWKARCRASSAASCTSP